MNNASTWTARATAAVELQFSICARYQSRATKRYQAMPSGAERDGQKQAAFAWGSERSRMERILQKLARRAKR